MSYDQLMILSTFAPPNENSGPFKMEDVTGHGLNHVAQLSCSNYSPGIHMPDKNRILPHMRVPQHLRCNSHSLLPNNFLKTPRATWFDTNLADQIAQIVRCSRL